MNQPVKNFSGQWFVRMGPNRWKKLNKITDVCNSTNLQKKEIISKKIGRKSLVKQKDDNYKQSDKEHSEIIISNIKIK